MEEELGTETEGKDPVWRLMVLWTPVTLTTP